MADNHWQNQKLLTALISIFHLILLFAFYFFIRELTVLVALLSMVLTGASAWLHGRRGGLVSALVLGLLQVGFLIRFDWMAQDQSAQFGTIFPILSLLVYLVFLLGFGTGLGWMIDQTHQDARLYEQTMLDWRRRHQDVVEQLRQAERQMNLTNSVKSSPLSCLTGDGQDVLCSPLVGLVLENLRQNSFSAVLVDHKMIQKPNETDDPNTLLMNLLAKLRPEILAILTSDGKILQYNRRWMSILGISTTTNLARTSFLDFLLPDSVSAARSNLMLLKSAAFDNQSHYSLRSAAGRYTQVLIPTEVQFERSENQDTILVLLCEHSSSSADQTRRGLFDPAQRTRLVSNLEDLQQRDLCCLSASGQINCFYLTSPCLLGQPAETFQGKRLESLIESSSLPDFQQFLTSLQTGDPATVEVIVITPTQKRLSMRFDAYPTFGETDTYLGATLLISQVTDSRQTEAALNHRLVIERLISSISTRFISLQIDEIDQEICAVLNTFEALESVSDCSIEVRKLNQSPCNLFYRSKDLTQRMYSNQSSRSLLTDRFELVSVPIDIQSETVGYFHLCQEKFRDSWVGSDYDLIRTIGEIIINALIRKENEMHIKLNENRLSTTLHSIGDAVIATDTDDRIILMNEQAEMLTGWDWSEARLQPVESIFRPTLQMIPSSAFPPYVHQTLDPSDSDTRQVLEDSVLLESRSGKQYFIAVNQSPIVDQSQAFWGNVTVFRDVTSKKQEEDKIRYISYHDKLTDLYNRAFFEEELIRLNTKRQYPITVILSDCNGLKIANDIFGHLEGDRLLVTIANILKKATRHEDVVARWGGDEFAIILPRTDEQAAQVIRDRILQFCEDAGNNPIQPSLALGSATNTDGSSDLIQLLKIAEDRMYRHKLMESKSTRNTLIQSIEKMVSEKSFETEEHATRMAELAGKLGRVIGLSEFEQEELSLLTVLHDIGKIGIPDKILLKPDRLNEEEWGVMKKHAEKGYNLAKSTPELVNIADAILHHHERWDGTGYPAGLQGEQIPKLSRVLSIIDAYDVITHPRAYKQAQSIREALEEIKRCAGSQFDPVLTKAFLEIMEQQKLEHGLLS